MTTAGQTATSAASPSAAEIQTSTGLIGEFLRLVGVPSTACAVVASGLWTVQQQLQQQPVEWMPAIACTLAGLMSIFQLAHVRRNHGPATLIAIVIGLALTAVAVNFGSSGNAAVSAVWMMATFQLLIAIVSFPIPKLSSKTMVPEDVEPAATPSEHDLVVTNDSLDNPSEKSSEARKRGRWIALAILIAAFFVYMVLVPAVGMVIESISRPKVSSRVLTDMTFSESIRLHSVSGVVMLCFLAMGASIGSFLNVVIYRSPRFKPLLWPPSSCGNCGTRIQGKDNIPIFAWIFLGGRCRSCHIAISSRYPLVEVAVAAIFVLFYYVELLSGGDNLPYDRPTHIAASFGFCSTQVGSRADLFGSHVHVNDFTGMGNDELGWVPRPQTFGLGYFIGNDCRYRNVSLAVSDRTVGNWRLELACLFDSIFRSCIWGGCWRANGPRLSACHTRRP